MVARLAGWLGGRAVCVAGATLAAAGMLLASLASHLPLLLLGYSVTAGLGFGMIYLPSVLAAAPHFQQRRALAMAVTLCGSGAGTLLLAPLSQAVLQAAGWRAVLRTFSGLCMACVVCGAALTSPAGPDSVPAPAPQSTESPNTSKPGSRLLGLVLGPALAASPALPIFTLILLADFFTFAAVYIPYSHLPGLAMARGLSPGQTAAVISAGGAANTVGRLTGGGLADTRPPLPLTLLAVATAALPCFILTACSSLPAFLASFALFGLLTGVQVGCASPLLVSLLGMPALAPAFGALTAGRGVAALVGPPLAGLLADTTASLASPLHLTGGLLLAGAALYTAALALHSSTRNSGYEQL